MIYQPRRGWWAITTFDFGNGNVVVADSGRGLDQRDAVLGGTP